MRLCGLSNASRVRRLGDFLSSLRVIQTSEEGSLGETEKLGWFLPALPPILQPVNLFLVLLFANKSHQTCTNRMAGGSSDPLFTSPSGQFLWLGMV